MYIRYIARLIAPLLVFLVVLLGLLHLAPSGSPAGQHAGLDEPDANGLLELRCRGGSLLLFSTRGASDQHPDGVRMSLIFSAGRRPAGSDGRNLDPGTCAWPDRPFDSMEPPQIWYDQVPGQAVPEEGLRDPDNYWLFMVSNTGRGHFAAAWQLGPMGAVSEPGPPRDRYDWSNLPHVIRDGLERAGGDWRLPFFGSIPGIARILLFWFAAMAITWFVITWAKGRFGAWGRLVERYPGAAVREGTRFWCPFLKLGTSGYRNSVRLRADRSHLHVSAMLPVRPGHPPFSVPWSDITLSREKLRWGLLPFDVIRFTFAAAPDLDFLVHTQLGERVVAASGGQVRLPEQEPPRAGARARARG